MAGSTGDSRSATMIALIGIGAGILGTIVGGLGSFYVQRANLSHQDHVALTSAREEAYVGFLDAVDTLALDTTKFVEPRINTTTGEANRTQTLADRERLGPAIERINILATRDVERLAGPLVDAANGIVERLINSSGDIRMEMHALHDQISAARGPFVSAMRHERGV